MTIIIGMNKIVAYTLLAYDNAQTSPFTFGNTLLVNIENSERDRDPNMPNNVPITDKLPKIIKT